jgi:hypothetical protein
MSILLSDTTNNNGIIQLVQQELSDFKQAGAASMTGDGITLRFKLPDACIETGVGCTVGGALKSETTDWTLDYDSGWFTFTSAPALGAALLWNYTCRQWSKTQYKTSINAAIDYCAKGFYSVAYDNSTITDGTTKDFPLPPRTDKVRRVVVNSAGLDSHEDEWMIVPSPSCTVTAHTANFLSTTTATTLQLASGNGLSVSVGDVLKDAAQNELVQVATQVSADTFTVTRGYRSTTAVTHASAATWNKWGEKILHFPVAPNAGSLKLTYVKRPSHLSADADTLEYTSGMPEWALEPIIYYAAFKLMGQYSTSNMKNGKYVAEGDYDPARMMNRASQYKLMADAALASLRMRPMPGRAGL